MNLSPYTASCKIINNKVIDQNLLRFIMSVSSNIEGNYPSIDGIF